MQRPSSSTALSVTDLKAHKTNFILRPPGWQPATIMHEGKQLTSIEKNKRYPKSFLHPVLAPAHVWPPLPHSIHFDLIETSRKSNGKISTFGGPPHFGEGVPKRTERSSQLSIIVASAVRVDALAVTLSRNRKPSSLCSLKWSRAGGVMACDSRYIQALSRT